MDDTKGRWNGHTSSTVKARYAAKVYDRVSFNVPKGQRDVIKAKADEAGQSMAEYICAALTAFGCPVTSKIQQSEE